MGPETTMDDRIVAEAARWHARLVADDCTDVDRAQFECWRASSRRHADAYQAAEALSAQLAHWARLDDRLRSMADDALAMGIEDERQRIPHDEDLAVRTTLPSRARRWMVPAAMAAGIVVALAGVLLFGHVTRSAPPVTYASSRQTQRDVTLADGSMVHLDVDSEIRVSFSEGQRQIVLVDGRALFEVAHDATRPFVVSAGASHTTALGTHFQVQREGQEVLVTLAEGSVAVTSDAEQSRWRESLAPGEQISLTVDGQARVKRAVDAQVVTSWSRGRLVFRGTPLGEALKEVNRYGSRKVRLGDPDLADLPVGGNFIAGETDLIVSAFAAVLPLRVSEGSAGEILLFRRYKADAP
jgi:transmembrane sensor